MPRMADEYFAKSIILLLQHDRDGALGLIINATYEITVDELLFDMGSTAYPSQPHPIMRGGPLQPELCWALHSTDHAFSQSASVGEYLRMSPSHQLLTQLINNKIPRHYMIGLGYAAWTHGQLDQEIENHDWCPAALDLDILSVQPNERWRWMLTKLGLTSHPIHAALS